MHGEFFEPTRPHGTDTGVVPDVRSRPTVLSQLEIVDVSRSTVLPHEHQFVLGSIERSHPAIGLVPYAQIFKLAKNLAAGREHFGHVPPIHAYLMDRTIDGVERHQTEYRLQERGELSLVHLAASHCKVSVSDATEPTNMAVDWHVVRRISEHEFRGRAFEHRFIRRWFAGVPTI